MITQKYVKECLAYDEDTGVLTWRVRPESHFCSVRVMNGTNAKVAGSRAGSKGSNGRSGKIYRRLKLDQKVMYEHSLIFFYMTGEKPEEVDHINGNGEDNRWVNLRAANRKLNTRNTKMPITNTSGHVGVRKRGDKYQARIKVDKKEIHLGLFVDINDAIVARKAAEKLHGFHENHGINRSSN